MLPLSAVGPFYATPTSLPEPQPRLSALSASVNTKGFIFRKTVSDKIIDRATNKAWVHSGIHAPNSNFLPISDCFGWLTISILGWSPNPIIVQTNRDCKKTSVKMSHLLLCPFCLSHLLYVEHMSVTVSGFEIWLTWSTEMPTETQLAGRLS